MTDNNSAAPAVIFKGKSGREYWFHAWPFDTKFKSLGGVYIVTKRSFNDLTFTTKASHHPQVIGHTANLADALLSRSQRARLIAQGANYICVCEVAGAARRIEIEKDLVDGNESHRGPLQCLYYLSDPQSRPAQEPAGS